MMFKILIFLFCQTYLISFVSSLEVSVVSDVKTVFGGSPFWDVETQSLLFVDVFGTDFDILRYDWREDKIYKAVMPIDLNPKVVIFIIPLKGKKDLFAVGVSSRVVKLVRWDGVAATVEILGDLFSVEQSEEYSGNYWHMSRADPKGRFFGGTFRSEFCSSSSAANASLYRYTKERGAERLSEMKLPGGMDWNPRTNTYYFINMCEFVLQAYDWCPETGELSNERIAFKYYDGVGPSDVAPVSVAIDDAGMIYTSMYNGSAIWKINPETSELLDIIEIPTEIVVNMVLGGPNLDVLFVTTASAGFGIYTGLPTNQTLTEVGGSLFKITGVTSPGHGGRKLSII